MRTLLLISALMFSFAVMAEASFNNIVLSCNVDALDSVEIIEGANGNRIEITQINGEVEKYILKRTLKYVKAGDSDTLEAAMDFNNTHGNMTINAILMRVFKGGKSAKMGAHGNVYNLDCTK